MAAPSIVKLVEPRTNTNRVGLAVLDGDGDIQDLDTHGGKPIQDGSSLRVCTAGWAAIKAVYERINAIWSKIGPDLV